MCVFGENYPLRYELIHTNILTLKYSRDFLGFGIRLVWLVAITCRKD
jgi:hypothetical protein